MIVFRITQRAYANDLSGIGAGLYGGRWNPKGINMVYTAESISLSCMEYLVHNIHLLNSKTICLSKIQIPDDVSILKIKDRNLPLDWNEKSYIPLSTQEIGRNFIKDSLNYMLKVPSVIVPNEYNYLLNPQHNYHSKSKIIEIIDPFKMDSRLFNF